MPKVKDLLQLVRIPGVFTAHADILAGALVAGASFRQIPDLLLLLIASSCLFSAGMALNDYFDRTIDKTERPSRPIPSGRISENAALLSGLVMLITGVLSAYFVNGFSLSIAILLAIAIFSYDGLLKHHKWIGPLNMGFCRYLNLLLGLSILPLDTGIMLIPLLTWLYIFGITVLSASEVKGRDPLPVSICLACISGVTVLYFFFSIMNLFQNEAGLYFCLVWMASAAFFPLRLFSKTGPGDYQMAIKWLLMLLVILDGIIVIGARSPAAAIFVFPLILPGSYVAKRFYVT